MNEFETIMAAVDEVVAVYAVAPREGDNRLDNTTAALSHLFDLLAPLMDLPPEESEKTVVAEHFNNLPKGLDPAQSLYSDHRGVFPVFIVRYLLAFKKVTLVPAKISQWDKFSDRYQETILAA